MGVFDLVTFTLNFDLLLKNFNLMCYLVMVGECLCLLTTLITLIYYSKNRAALG